MRFADLPLMNSTHAALEAMGFVDTTPIQQSAIPVLLAGRDLLGQAQTGTGKTAAFGVPLVEAAHAGRRALVLVPTRELAKQVQRELQAIAKNSPVDVVCLTGGAPFGDQVRAIQRHPGAILVATPGRIVDHLGRGTLRLADVAALVLDEADEMLSMGFADELDAILAALPQERQSILLSATIGPDVERLSRHTLRDPHVVRIAGAAASNVQQMVAVVPGRDRVAAIARIIEAFDPEATILFARTRARVEELQEELRPLGAEALHGGMAQPARDGVMARLRDGTTSLLVATDVAARGLDVDQVGLILHDGPPGDAETYVHRIGRTGRAGRTGVSVLLMTPGKTHQLGPLRRVAGRLQPYDIPNDAQLDALRSQRIIDGLAAQEPSQAARALVQDAVRFGMSIEDVAAGAIHALLRQQAPPPADVQPAAEEPVAIALKVGAMDHIHPGSIVGVLTNAAGLRAEDVGRIDILERMTVVEVPASEAERVMEALQRVRLSGRPVLPRAAQDWRFRQTPRR